MKKNTLRSYNETVCSGKVFNGQADQRYCEDTKAIILENNNTILGSSCRESCSEPGYGCLACTNPDPSIVQETTSRSASTLSLCAISAQTATNAVDENLDMCYDKYIAQGKIDESATLMLQQDLREHGNFASVCDGVAVSRIRMKPDVCAKKLTSLAQIY